MIKLDYEVSIPLSYRFSADLMVFTDPPMPSFLVLEEVFENREQIEISRYYEKLPKATLLATQEFVDGNIYWRDPSKDNLEQA